MHKWVRGCIGLLTAMLLTGCVTSGIKKVPSANYNDRVSILVIHHTSGDFNSSLNILTKPSTRPVSSHYLVPEPNDPSYKGKKLKVYQLVDEDKRAWHAGASYWGGKSSLNDHSIGIEIVNRTWCAKQDGGMDLSDNAKTADGKPVRHPERFCFYPDFAENQIDLVIDLVKDILARHPRISPVNIVGHSDIAPQRKIDPGPRFPWQRLYQEGIGTWFEEKTVLKYWNRFEARPPSVRSVQKALSAYGYKIEITGVLDEQTRNVIKAFQMHYRPMTVTGKPDTQTSAILYALLEKYRPKKLDEVLP